MRFFGWARRLVVDAFYTSEIGRQDLEYQGNQFIKTFEVPGSAVSHVMKRG